jgi:F like protein
VSAADFEGGLFTRVFAALGRWLKKVRDAVLGAFGQPDPSAVLGRRSEWNREVANLMPSLEEIAAAGWADGSGRPFVDTSTFIMADLARAQNFLRNVANEVYALLVSEMIEGQQAGEGVNELRTRIERVLDLTGTNRWANRAHVIATTETTRAWSAGVYASALYYEPATGVGWVKIWVTRQDGRERPSHRRADGQTVPLRDYFQVGDVPMRYPGDPAAPPKEVVGCRCHIDVRERVEAP